MPEPDYGVSLSAPTKSIKPKARTVAASKASRPKAAAPRSFMDKFKASITGPPVENKVTSYSHPTDNDDSGASAMQGGIKSLSGATADADMYAENLKRYNDYLKSQGQPVGGPMGGKGGPRTMPQQAEITPEMREAALGMFESQQGAGQVPYYMAAARDDVNYRRGGNRDDYRQGGNRDDFGMPIVGGPPPQNPNMSPAFQYAAQNYDVLGGSQRLAPRPMEMMSVAERNRINDMSQAMADQAAQRRMEENEYRKGLTAGKGGPRTLPQLHGGQFSSMEQLMEFQQANPSMNLMGEYQRLQGLGGGTQTQPPMPQPQYGGGLSSILAKRFGPMGGSGGFGF